MNSSRLTTSKLPLTRLAAHEKQYPELKDPCIIKLPGDMGYMLYASIGTSVTQQWVVGRFHADTLAGPWQEGAPVHFTNLTGPQLCAPALHVEGNVIHMYIQTGCFEENTTIVHATSTDGEHFTADPNALITKDSTVDTKHPIIGVYDAGISSISLEGVETRCMVYSAYRKIGCGDMYVTLQDPTTKTWMRPHSILDQEHMPYHNDPDSSHFEWGLEGGKIDQLADNLYLLIGVCFLPKPEGSEGRRQRIFIAASRSVLGPFVPVGLPFAPTTTRGEIGHPDTIVNDTQFTVVYQERYGNGKQWYLRVADLSKAALTVIAESTLRKKERLQRRTHKVRYLFPTFPANRFA